MSKKNAYMLENSLEKCGYDWWWHHFVGVKRSTKEQVPLFVQYQITNPTLYDGEMVIGQLPVNKKAGKKPSYAMIRAGRWGEDKLHLMNFFPPSQFSGSRTHLDVKIHDNICTETELVGCIQTSAQETELMESYIIDAGEMSWNLKMKKNLTYDTGIGSSWFARKLNAFDMFWHVQGIQTLYEGEVIINGEFYDVHYDSSYGYQDKNWGSDFTNPWIWLGCNDFISKESDKRLLNTSLDIGGGTPVLFGRRLQSKLVIAFYYNGVLYDFNFAKPLNRVKQTFSYENTDEQIVWKVSAENRNSKIVAEFSCKKSYMIKTNPENPRGERNHQNLFNGGHAEGRLELFEKKGKKYKSIDRLICKNVGCELGD